MQLYCISFQGKRAIMLCQSYCFPSSVITRRNHADHSCICNVLFTAYTGRIQPGRILHGGETWPVNKENEMATEHAEIRMNRWTALVCVTSHPLTAWSIAWLMERGRSTDNDDRLLRRICHSTGSFEVRTIRTYKLKTSCCCCCCCLCCC